MTVTPIASISHRIQEGGRIRIGTSEKAKSRGGKVFDKPVKLDRFRFTSSDANALAEIAAIYGGTVQPWTHDKAAAGQYELLTEANEIKVALPPDPLGGSPIYELWDGGGRTRSCDGVTCDLVVSAGDGYEVQSVPCLCDAKGELACKVTTHLSVLLPEIKFIGVWRITSHGWNAATELPGMVAGIRQLQDRGIQRALLRVEERVQVKSGRKREFMVPVLAIDASVNALVAGAAALGSLGAGSSVSGELIAGEGAGSSLSPADDEIVDAEIVGDGVGSLADYLPADVPPGKALVFARKAAKDRGMPLPTTLEAVTDEHLISAVLDEVTQ